MNKELYVMVWIEEELRWDYILGDFNETDYLNGYTDYTIEVENNIIIGDTYNKLNVGKLFDNVYDKNLWNINN